MARSLPGTLSLARAWEATARIAEALKSFVKIQNSKSSLSFVGSDDEQATSTVRLCIPLSQKHPSWVVFTRTPSILGSSSGPRSVSLSLGNTRPTTCNTHGVEFNTRLRPSVVYSTMTTSVYLGNIPNIYIDSHMNKFRITEITSHMLDGIKFRPQHLNLPSPPNTSAYHVFRPSTPTEVHSSVNELIVTQIEQFDSQSNTVSPTKKPSVLPTGFLTIGGTPLSVVPEVVPSTFPGSQQLWAEVGPTPSLPMSPLPEVPATPRKLRITPSVPASPSLRRSKSKLSSGQTTPIIRRSVPLAEEMDDQPDFAPAAPARFPSRSSAESNDEPPSLLRPELISDMIFHESIITSLKKQKTAASSVLASPDAIPDKLRSVANLLCQGVVEL